MRFGRVRSADMAMPDNCVMHDEGETGVPFIYGGILWRNFGRFVGDFAHRLWVLGHPRFEGATVLFAGSVGQKVPAFFEQLMDLLGVQKWQIIEKPSVVRSLVVGEQGKQLGRKSRRSYTAFLEDVAIRNGLRQADRPKKIAVMRGHLQTRRFVGEATFERYLETQGYYLLKPEHHSVKDQLSFLASAEQIILSDGSACHLLDLLPALSANISFFGSVRRSRLEKYSLKPKAVRLTTVLAAKPILQPLHPDGRPRKNRALLHLSWCDAVAALKRNGFLSADAPEFLAPPPHADIAHYVAANGVLVRTDYMPDLAITDALDQAGV